VVEQPEAAWPENTSIIDGLRNNVLEWDLDEPTSFVTVSSEIYPGLAMYFERDAERWLTAVRGEWLD
jgi:hypothetical protein